ncbi:S8 family peptidase [Listeria rocourtiae]|uniref:S8 family peptidase n=1 Tax=Listeria rocourtiae TaxID=647910 RepID=UPI003D2F8066
MNKERYPIIKFSHRKQDNLRTEGGGSSKVPSWVLDEQHLQDKSQELISDLNSLKYHIGEYPSHIPHAIEVSFIDDAKAKSHQSLIISMFKVSPESGQIGMSGENSILVNMDSEISLNRVISNVQDLNRYRNQISAITSINVYEPKIIENSEINEDVYKMSFLDFQDAEKNNEIHEYILTELREHKITFNERVYNEEEKIIEITEHEFDRLQFLKKLPIKSLEPIEKTQFPFPVIDFLNEDKLEVGEYNSNIKYPVVGLLDSGVAINKYTDGWVIKGRGCAYREDQLDTNHGTFIATLLIHGNEINNCEDYSFKGCTIIDVPVVPMGGIDEITLVNNIRDAVEQNPEVNVWNLSVSLKGEIASDRFSNFAVSLDKIQDEFNVIICKSAGNDSSFYNNDEAGLLSVGAESIRAVTVGSLNRGNDEYGFCRKNYPAPYSRTGRGPGFIIKPELVHFGGDVIATVEKPRTREDFREVSEIGISSDERLATHVGTSFSTPKVAKNIAELSEGLRSEFNPLLLKALLTHSAGYAENLNISGEERLLKMGYGKPLNSRDILVASSPYSTTLVLQGNLRKGEKIDIMDFPYPKNLIEAGKYKGQIKATLVYNNFLEADLGPEYCQSDIKLRFGTYSEKFDRDLSKQTILNPIGRKNATNLLNKGLYSKKIIKANEKYATERMLIQYGDKYYPVKKFAADLSELKNSVSEESLDHSKSWFLYLEGQYRDFILKKYDRESKVLSMDYCVVITISDPDYKEDVYMGTIRELESNNFVYDDIEISSNIDINF